MESDRDVDTDIAVRPLRPHVRPGSSDPGRAIWRGVVPGPLDLDALERAADHGGRRRVLRAARRRADRPAGRLARAAVERSESTDADPDVARPGTSRAVSTFMV